MTKGKISPIRDTVHDYISPTIFEREVIDSLYFQRLHFVLQNSTVYSTYPCNKNSRFAHSLGVSHVAGRMFLHAMRNSSALTLESFLKCCLSIIEDCTDNPEKCKAQWSDSVGNAARFMHNPVIKSTQMVPGETLVHSDAGFGETGYSVDFIVNTFWIALRLCGLCHDIGHMPSSHLFEHALDDLKKDCLPNDSATSSEPTNNGSDRITVFDIYQDSLDDVEGGKRLLQHALQQKSTSVFAAEATRTQMRKILAIIIDDADNFAKYLDESMALHEVRGYQILDEIIRKSDDYIKEYSDYRDLLFKISQLIFLCCSRDLVKKNSSKVQALLAMRNLVAGEIDADRLDYTMRDASASGVELGSLDLERIVSSQILLSPLDASIINAGKQGLDTFRIGTTASSVSALVTFFHHRYMSYEQIIYHKAVQRSAALLGEIVKILIVYCACKKSHDVSQICRQRYLVGAIAPNYDVDSILPSEHYAKFDDGWLRGILFECRDVLLKIEASGQSSNLDRILLGLIDAWATRDTKRCYALLKDRSHAQQYLDARSSQLNDLAFPNFAIADATIRKMNLKSVKDGELLFLMEVKPKIYGALRGGSNDLPQLVYDKNTGQIHRLEDLSAHLRSLGMVYDRSPSFLLFAFRTKKYNDFPHQKRDEALEAILSGHNYRSD